MPYIQSKTLLYTLVKHAWLEESNPSRSSWNQVARYLFDTSDLVLLNTLYNQHFTIQGRFSTNTLERGLGRRFLEFESDNKAKVQELVGQLYHVLDIDILMRQLHLIDDTLCLDIAFRAIKDEKFCTKKEFNTLLRRGLNSMIIIVEASNITAEKLLLILSVLPRIDDPDILDKLIRLSTRCYRNDIIDSLKRAKTSLIAQYETKEPDSIVPPVLHQEEVMKSQAGYRRNIMFQPRQSDTDLRESLLSSEDTDSMQQDDKKSASCPWCVIL